MDAATINPHLVGHYLGTTREHLLHSGHIKVGDAKMLDPAFGHLFHEILGGCHVLGDLVVVPIKLDEIHTRDAHVKKGLRNALHVQVFKTLRTCWYPRHGLASILALPARHFAMQAVDL
jgi:hypothetical protein